MVGDQPDIVARLRVVLPSRWFGDASPVLDGVLSGIASIWSGIHDLLQVARLQTRITTASGAFLDMAAADFFGNLLPRRANEDDGAYSSRIRREFLRERGTRKAVVAALTDLTGRVPKVFEPQRPQDTGGWGGGAGYGAAGGWGSLALPMQCFVDAYRPVGQGISTVGGWGSGAAGWGIGAMAYMRLSDIEGQVTDDDIAEAVARMMPVASVAWIRISS